jgi:protein-disulfide isomerase
MMPCPEYPHEALCLKSRNIRKQQMTSLFCRTSRLMQSIFCITVLFVLTLVSQNFAYAGDDLNLEQRKEIEGVIYDYLMDNPEVILQAVEKLRNKEERAEQESVREHLTLASEAIYNDPLSPYAGNPNGSVTIVEFFDYRCGYCKRVFPALQELLESDDDLRIVFKELPILGEDSVLASRASLAIWINWPEKYLEFHTKLITSRGSITESKVYEYAAATAIDTEILKQEMKSESVDEAISRTVKLSRLLNINGTPGFIIGDELIPGAIDIDAMKDLIEQARQKS